MKKFWTIILAVGLVMALVMPAAATDVKFSGSYYVRGWAANNPSLSDRGASSQNPNTRGGVSLYDQRLRVNADFIVSEGLQLKTRFDALEKRWGDQTWTGSTSETASRASSGATGAKAQENIEFEDAYISYLSPIGQFNVGYIYDTVWGTPMGDTLGSSAQIAYVTKIGDVYLSAGITKTKEGYAIGRTTSAYAQDTDYDKYSLAAVYKTSAIEAGFGYQYNRDATARSSRGTSGTMNSDENSRVTIVHKINPYAKATFGPVYIETEFAWVTGKIFAFDNASQATGALGRTTDLNVETFAWAIHGKGTFGPGYAGAIFAWVRGDDPADRDKMTGGFLRQTTSGSAFAPLLIFGNSDYNTAVGKGVGNSTGANRLCVSSLTPDEYWDNIWFYCLYAGVKPMDKLDLKATYALMKADKLPRTAGGAWAAHDVNGNPTGTEYVSDKYGSEFDLTVTYDITANLQYMAGLGYFMTGDYYKGTDQNYQLSNNYLLMHKLTLTF
jgi:hypothetical protein